MRILVVSKFYPPVIGGVEITVKELCEQYAMQGHQVTAAVMTKGAFLDERINDVRVLRFPQEKLFHGSLNRGVASFMRKELDESHYDIVHVHNFHIVLSFQSALMCSLRSMPYVFSPHYHGKGHTPIRDVFFQLYKQVGVIGLRRAKAITCASEHERRKLLKDFPELEGNTVVISPGIAPRKAVEREREPDTLLYVGRLMGYKGLDHTLQAMKVLRDRNRRVRLRVVGTGPAEKGLRKLVSELDMEDQVAFLGELSEEALADEYARASCLVLLSSAEAYGLVVAEALASGTPCIVANSAALTEFTSEPGCFGVSWPPNPEEIAEAIERVLDEGSRLKVGPFSQKISYWPEVASRYLELYGRVLEGDRSS